MNLFDDILEPTKKEKTKKNYVVIALDESGSMTVVRQETIDFFNSQVIEARNAKEMDNRICLITFSDRAEIKIWDVDADEVDLINEETYKPGGWTAMLDGIGMGITRLLNQSDINDESVSVLFIVISDGQENFSKEYNFKTIADLINDVTKTNRWSFVYLGANQDLSQAKDLGISAGNTLQFSSNNQSMISMTQAHCNASREYYTSRGAGMTMTDSFYGGVSADGDKDPATSINKNRKRKKTA